mmetsp:Transcript_2942/g.7336  ORF Transcript_2942/g.7336 Transcript_2942/m.7336 type:complete len:88 (+) Transcript_2942:250-513(+)
MRTGATDTPARNYARGSPVPPGVRGPSLSHLRHVYSTPPRRVTYAGLYILQQSSIAWSSAEAAAGSALCLAFIAAVITAWCALRAST